MLTIIDWFQEIWDKLFKKINDWMISTFKIDQNIFNLYNKFVSPIPEVFKILGAILIGIILILGIISFAKKFLKLLIVIAVIAIIVLLISGLVKPGGATVVLPIYYNYLI